MRYWDRLVYEVINKDSPHIEFLITNYPSQNEPVQRAPRALIQKRKRRGPQGRFYPLFSDKTEPHLTLREAQCIILLMEGLTFKQMGDALNLSARTVEYYLNNIKEKLNCASRPELMQLIQRSGFLKRIKRHDILRK